MQAILTHREDITGKDGRKWVKFHFVNVVSGEVGTGFLPLDKFDGSLPITNLAEDMANDIDVEYGQRDRVLGVKKL